MDRHPEDIGLEHEDWDIIFEVTQTDSNGKESSVFGSIDNIPIFGILKGRMRIFKGRMETLEELSKKLDLGDPNVRALLPTLIDSPTDDSDADEEDDDAPLDSV